MQRIRSFRCHEEGVESVSGWFVSRFRVLRLGSNCAQPLRRVRSMSSGIECLNSLGMHRIMSVCESKQPWTRRFLSELFSYRLPRSFRYDVEINPVVILTGYFSFEIVRRYETNQ